MVLTLNCLKREALLWTNLTYQFSGPA